MQHETCIYTPKQIIFNNNKYSQLSRKCRYFAAVFEETVQNVPCHSLLSFTCFEKLSVSSVIRFSLPKFEQKRAPLSGASLDSRAKFYPLVPLTWAVSATIQAQTWTNVDLGAKLCVTSVIQCLHAQNLVFFYVSEQ